MASVTNISTYKENKKNNILGNQLLDGFNMPEYHTKALEMMLQSAVQIIYFSGETEQGESREIKKVNSFQVVSAAKNIRYNFEVLGRIIRIKFDGGFIYDAYLDSTNNEFFAKYVEVLELETNVNENIFEVSLNNFSDSYKAELQNKMSLGEKIEVLIFKRESSTSCGEYIGSTANFFGTVKIDNVIYKIKRNIETDLKWFWKIINANTGKEITLDDQYDLPLVERV